MGWFTFSQEGVRLGHAGCGQLRHREGFMISLSATDERSISCNQHMKTWVWDKNCWEIVDVYIKTSLESKGSSKRGHNLSNQPIEVNVGWAFNIKCLLADIVQSLVIKVESKVRVLKERVSRKNSVVRLNNSSGYLWRWSDGEAHLSLSAEVNSKTFKKERSKTGSSTSSSGMEDKETLESGAVVTHLADLVHYRINDVLADSVVTTSVVVSSVFLSIDDGLRVVKLTVGSGTDRVTNSWLKINHYGTRYVLAALGLREESIEGSVLYADGLVAWHFTIVADAVFKAVKFPAAVSDSETGLSNVKRE